MKKWFNKIKTNFKNATKGFSLVELIVVIAIMAVMAAVLAPALLGYVERSRAQKDDSAMGEVTNAIQLSLADMDVYDEALQFAVKDNYSCYADGDTSTNTDANKITTKEPDLWLFNDQARLLDETVYKPAGKMRGVTVTLKPNGSAEYILKDGIVNKIGDDSTKKGANAGKTLADCPELYNRLRSTVGDTITVSSQTYRNSDYTIFISMGTTGGNQADKQDAIKVYGQYNGTNLAEVAAPVAGGSQSGGNAGAGGSEQPGGGAPAVTLPAKGKTLEQYTWAEVRDIIAAGKATEYGFAVGGTKTLSINGATKTATIVGLNHDGSNTATFMIVSSGGIGYHVMNTDYTNAGGWEASEMRAWLNGNIYNSMSNKDCVKTVTKMTNNTGYQGTTATSTSDKVFLLSPKEAGVADDIAGWSWYPEEYKPVLETEGTTYTWFETNTVDCRFSLRSPNSDDSYFFFSYNHGDLHYVDADGGSTVCPAFVIG